MVSGYHIASVSWGKDSTFLLYELVRRGYPLDEVVTFDVGMEFDAIYHMRDRALPFLREHGILYTELKMDRPFEYYMFDHLVHGRNGIHYGYSWCGGRVRWGTTQKIRAMDQYAEERGAYVYLGIAADEQKRLHKKRKPYKLTPMADWGATEAMALQSCYENGFTWQEGNVYLYDILKRVSCWCCAGKNLTELRNMHKYLPHYRQRLRALQAKTNRPMKGEGNSVFDLEDKFLQQMGGPIERDCKDENHIHMGAPGILYPNIERNDAGCPGCLWRECA